MASPDTVILPANSVDTDAIRDCLNDAFSDYLIRMPTFDAMAFDGFLHRQGVDLSLSRVGARDGRVMSFALVTPRGADCWRIAVMGARPEARGSGLAPRLLDDTISNARSRQLRSVELEVFAQNVRAFRLYQSRGMQPATVLHGFEAPIGSRRAHLPVRSVTLETGADRACEIEANCAVALPWQVCGEAILRLPLTALCWQSGDAQLVFTEQPGLIVVLSLLDSDSAMTGAIDLLSALRASYPEAVLRAPQLQAEHGPSLAFKAAGWVQAELYQYLMVRQS